MQHEIETIQDYIILIYNSTGIQNKLLPYTVRNYNLMLAKQDSCTQTKMLAREHKLMLDHIVPLNMSIFSCQSYKPRNQATATHCMRSS